jgi:hypothetical protein
MILARWHPKTEQGDGVPVIPQLRFNKWSPKHPDRWHFESIHPEWLIGEKPATPREVIRQIRRIGDGGIIELVEPFYSPKEGYKDDGTPYGLFGAPLDNFGPEWANLTRDGLRWAYKSLRGLLRMSAAEIDRIRILTDHERWSLESYSGQRLTRPYGELANEWTTWGCREAGFDGPRINHATLPFGHPPVGKPAQTSAKGLTVPHLASYVNDDTQYTDAEIVGAFEDCRPGFVYTHLNKSNRDLIRLAEKYGADATLLWN